MYIATTTDGFCNEIKRSLSLISRVPTIENTKTPKRQSLWRLKICKLIPKVEYPYLFAKRMARLMIVGTTDA